MLKRSAVVFAFLMLPCLTAHAGPTTQVAQQEDALVLRAALKSQCEAKDGYVLLSTTLVAPVEAYDMGGADESGAFADLKRRTGSAVRLPEDFTCKGVRLHREKDIQRFFDHESSAANQASLDESWKKLYKSFPEATGWTSVSLPGYSPDGDIAVVYVAHHCGTLCGMGTYVYLRRARDGWEVLVRVPVWVS